MIPSGLAHPGRASLLPRKPSAFPRGFHGMRCGALQAVKRGGIPLDVGRVVLGWCRLSWGNFGRMAGRPESSYGRERGGEVALAHIVEGGQTRHGSAACHADDFPIMGLVDPLGRNDMLGILVGGCGPVTHLTSDTQPRKLVTLPLQLCAWMHANQCHRLTGLVCLLVSWV